MSCGSRSTHELGRLATLKSSGLILADLDFLKPELSFLCRELEFPICVLTLLGKHFQHIKVAIGTDLTLTHRDHAFCSYTILQDDVLVVENATKDIRFKNNPYVIDGPAIRFYAGAPLLAKNGQRLGTLCMIDTKPRQLSIEHRDWLAKISTVIASRLITREPSSRLKRVSTSRLVELLKIEALSSGKDRLVALIDALYARDDKQVVWNRSASDMSRTRSIG